MVILQAEPGARIYDDVFYLKPVSLVQYLIRPPGPCVYWCLGGLAAALVFQVIYDVTDGLRRASFCDEQGIWSIRYDQVIYVRAYDQTTICLYQVVFAA